jgi:hypothetical protein
MRGATAFSASTGVARMSDSETGAGLFRAAAKGLFKANL